MGILNASLRADLFQEVFLLYSKKSSVTASTTSKMFIFALITFQVIELICYLVLFKHISEHNREMQRNNIISNDICIRRRHINVFSLSAQVIAFAFEFTFFGVSLVVKSIGGRYFHPDTRNFINSFISILFCINSTMMIIASSDLRQKFLAMLWNWIFSEEYFSFSFVNRTSCFCLRPSVKDQGITWVVVLVLLVVVHLLVQFLI